MNWDRVLTIQDYHDGRPINGVAEVQGVPHIFELEFDENADEFSDTYLVSVIDQDLLNLVLEGWEIWLSWLNSYNRNIVSIHTHPALLDYSERHREIKLAISGRLQVDRDKAVRLKAYFRNIHPNGISKDAEVLWISNLLPNICDKVDCTGYD